MNWYKLAQRDITVKGLTPEDLFAFYTAGSLDNSTLAENHDILDNFVIQVNQIRKYYLNFLIKQIADELTHAVYSPPAYMDSQEDFEAKYSFQDYIKDNHPDMTDEEVDMDEDLLDEYYEYTLESSDVTMPLSLKEEQFVTSFNTKSRQNPTLTAADFQQARDIFELESWSDSFGGEKWATITEWTQKLYFSPEINLYQPVEIKIKQAKNVAFILDVINSLEHNSNQVLVDLPHEEKYWMNSILDIVKHMKTPDALSYFTKDPKIMNVAVREAIFKQIPLQDKISHLAQMLTDMDSKSRKNFLSKISYSPIIDMLLNLNSNLIKDLLYNFNVSRENKLKILSELIAEHGAKYVIELLDDYGSQRYQDRWMRDVVNILPEAQRNEWDGVLQIMKQEQQQKWEAQRALWKYI